MFLLLESFGMSRSKLVFKIDVLENFANFTEKHLCWSLFLIKLETCNFTRKRIQLSCFPVKFAKFLITTFFHRTVPVAASGKRRCSFQTQGCSYGGLLARLSGLARLGEMIFIPRSHGIFYLSSIKKFVMSSKKII